MKYIRTLEKVIVMDGITTRAIKTFPQIKPTPSPKYGWACLSVVTMVTSNIAQSPQLNNPTALGFSWWHRCAGYCNQSRVLCRLVTSQGYLFNELYSSLMFHHINGRWSKNWDVLCCLKQGGRRRRWREAHREAKSKTKRSRNSDGDRNTTEREESYFRSRGMKLEIERGWESTLSTLLCSYEHCV